MKISRVLIPMATAILSLHLAPAAAAASQQLDIWTWRNPVPTANQLYSITHGAINGSTLWVAVGANSTIVTSSDGGVTWSLQAAPAPLATLNSVAYSSTSANHFVAVGSSDVNGNDVILFSPDGVTWTTATVPAPDNYGGLFGVAYGNGNFMAVGFDGYNYNSADGQNWTENMVNFAGDGIGDANGVAYGLIGSSQSPGFVAVGDNGVSTTINLGATAWTIPPYPPNGNNPSPTFLSGVTWNSGSGEFVAVGYGAIQNSPDGGNWYETTSVSGNAVAYGNSKFVAVNESSPYTIYTSPGASGGVPGADTWTPNTGNYPFDAIDFDGVKGNFVAVGPNGTIATSTTGTGWIPRNFSVTTNSLNAIAYGATAGTPAGYLFVAGGTNNSWGPGISGGPGIFTSPDGYTWTLDQDSSLNPMNNSVLSAGYINGLASGNLTINGTHTPEFVALVNRSGNYNYNGNPNNVSLIISSSDGQSWSVDDSLTAPAVLSGVAYGVNATGQPVFVVVGTDGTSYYSSDLVTWTPAVTRLPSNINLNALAYGSLINKPTFVAVGQGYSGGDIYYSNDGGNTWMAASSGPTTPYYLNGVAYGINPSGQPVFVAVGLNGSAFRTPGVIWTSPDGKMWTQQDSATTFPPFSSVTYANGFFVATTLAIEYGAGGGIWVSPDGVNWVQTSVTTSGSLHAVAYGDYQYIAVGDGGAILGSVLEAVSGGTFLSSGGGSGIMSFTAHGPPGMQYGVYASNDLVTWTWLKNITIPAGATSVSVTVYPSANYTQGYYSLGPPGP